MATLVLFDVDGTLLLTGGAGRRSMDRAFQEVYGVAGAFAGVPLAGRTDPGILAEAMARSGVAPALDGAERFQAAYFDVLAEELAGPARDGSDDWMNPRRFRGVFPGVREVLTVLGAREDVCVALLTGNYERAAAIKLDHFDLRRPFRCGAFGEDAAQRWELVDVARGRARALGCAPVAASDTWIVGDTPLDVAAARQAGVRSLAVATGGFGVEQLEASGADVAVGQLSVETLPF